MSIKATNSYELQLMGSTDASLNLMFVLYREYDFRKSIRIIIVARHRRLEVSTALHNPSKLNHKPCVTMGVDPCLIPIDI